MQKYGDVVVLVQKDAASGELRRTSAIVLSSMVSLPVNPNDRTPTKEVKEERIAAGEEVEHLDLAYPVAMVLPGSEPKTRNMEEIFRPAYHVAPYVDGAWIGYEVPASFPAEQGASDDLLGAAGCHAGEPSADDLDAIAADDAAREATRQIGSPTTDAGGKLEVKYRVDTKAADSDYVQGASFTTLENATLQATALKTASPDLEVFIVDLATGETMLPPE